MILGHVVSLPSPGNGPICLFLPQRNPLGEDLACCWNHAVISNGFLETFHTCMRPVFLVLLAEWPFPAASLQLFVPSLIVSGCNKSDAEKPIAMYVEFYTRNIRTHQIFSLCMPSPGLCKNNSVCGKHGTRHDTRIHRIIAMSLPSYTLA
ncbi:hypothetical protein DL89DRAFT_48811 [Linderina pennispora]|uniref:Uncharacterized protein n=1 Tax=Linderina pennispora TaxID=61395 RepID=A0A1Y1W2S6_9FUNG|nr:uncharacterized protein DL89DRAFT_48811 [Linderina pennispora]ORX67682.1 hypothetical protein DL89DRAFT_48811 [Linderina pennispora]